ncbi:MAG TPA: dihydroorotate dehydrogenase electron transfer subunit [Armatimonadetes bacterium]|nr:dihydroorotate dehydrogenase electron transfer subunit [Armatimonadota bacterium]
MKWQGEVEIVARQSLVGPYFKLTLSAPEIALSARPGQFVQVRCAPGYEPFLRRPFSIHGVNWEQGTVELLLRVVGRGTALLREKRVGEKLDVLGPLGQGTFTAEPQAHTIALVGGGVGLPPLHFFAQYWQRKGGLKSRILALLGARTKEWVLGEEEFAALGVEVHIATDDGSRGFPGPAVDLLGQVLREENIDRILTCGPVPMMRGVAVLAEERNLPCQVCLEARMACGVGACLSCVVETHSRESFRRFQRVCTEGPVFAAQDILWESLEPV